MRAHSNWERFYNGVDDIVPLAIRHVSHDATDKVPEDDLTWVERYRVEDLQKIQRVIKYRVRRSWLFAVHGLSFLVSGVLYFQRV